MSAGLTFGALVVSLAAAVCAIAEEPDFFTQFRQEFLKDKVAVVGEAMHLTPAQAAKFWPVYEEYEKERTAVIDRRLGILKDYGAALDTMSNRKADELLGRSFALRKDLLAVQERYANKLKVALSPILAARFAQIEQQVQLIQELKLAAKVPLIEEGTLVDPEQLTPTPPAAH